MSVKNIVLVTYSTTGNTKFVQDRIVKQLKSANYNISTFDALSIIKTYQLGRKNPENLSVEAVGGTLFPDLRQLIEGADVLGIGGFSFGMQTPPGLTDIFADNYFPSDLFKNLKYYFSFGTAGQRIGAVHDIIATLISTKNEKAIFLGGLTVICPENFAPLAPPSGHRDMWSQENIDKISPFVDSIIRVFDGSTPAQGVPFKKAYFGSSGMMETMVRLIVGKVVVDKSKCLKCGTCARNCPYGALSISPDIEDGFPHWDQSKCQYCHLCYNKCPKEALDFSAANAKNKARHPSPFLDPQTGAVLSTDTATHTVVGIPLPTPGQLLLRNAKSMPTPVLCGIVIVLLIIIFLLVKIVKIIF